MNRDQMSEQDLDVARARTAYFGLCDHVRDVHGVTCHGNAGQVEQAHRRAHAAEGTDSHDAWRLPEPGEVLR